MVEHQACIMLIPTILPLDFTIPSYNIKYILQGFCRFTFYINVNSYVSTFPLHDLFTNCIQMQYTSTYVLYGFEAYGHLVMESWMKYRIQKFIYVYVRFLSSKKCFVFFITFTHTNVTVCVNVRVLIVKCYAKDFVKLYPMYVLYYSFLWK